MVLVPGGKQKERINYLQKGELLLSMTLNALTSICVLNVFFDLLLIKNAVC